MIRIPAAALVAAALLLFPDDLTWAQTPPQPTPTPPRPEGTAPSRPRPRPRPPDTPMATICSTDEGWCPIKPVVLPGTPCECFLPPDIRLPDAARFFLDEGPVSPYLNPHRN